MKIKFFIDSHKFATGLFVFFLINYYQQEDNLVAWCYLALHGTYGLLWVLKSQFFPDSSWEVEIKLPMGIITWVSLTLYWVSPYIICTTPVNTISYPYLAFTIFVYALGVFLHFASDMQKHMSMKLKAGLVTDGLWSLSRNINYFGELLIYFSFVLLTQHWIPLVILFTWVVGYWYKNMIKKDKSLSRYPNFEQWKSKTKLFIPYVW